MTLAPVNRQPGIDVAWRTVHRLHKKMCEIERLILSQALVVLRNHDFELIALRDNQLSVRFWADANPINEWAGCNAAPPPGKTKNRRASWGGHGGATIAASGWAFLFLPPFSRSS